MVTLDKLLITHVEELWCTLKHILYIFSQSSYKPFGEKKILYNLFTCFNIYHFSFSELLFQWCLISFGPISCPCHLHPVLVIPKFSNTYVYIKLVGGSWHICRVVINLEARSLILENNHFAYGSNIYPL